MTAYQVAGEVTLMLHSGEVFSDSDPEALAELLYERGLRSADVHFSSAQERQRVQGAGQIGALKRKLRELAKVEREDGLPEIIDIN